MLVSLGIVASMSLAIRQLMIFAACALSLVLTVARSAPADVPTAVGQLVAAEQIVLVDARATAIMEPQTARLRR
jgi:hypothetical protein